MGLFIDIQHGVGGIMILSIKPTAQLEQQTRKKSLKKVKKVIVTLLSRHFDVIMLFFMPYIEQPRFFFSLTK